MDNPIELSGDWGKRLVSGLKKSGIEAPREMRDRVLLHLALIREECRRINLVSSTDRDFLIERHVLPSLEALAFVEDKPLRAICIGSGAGFPGVEVKIFRPSLEMTLLEATRKKALFLSRVVEELGLNGVSVLWKRAEQMSDESFDVALARGVAPMQKLQGLAAPLLKQGGKLITWKGSRFQEEMKAVRTLKFRVDTIHPYDPPRILVILRKL